MATSHPAIARHEVPHARGRLVAVMATTVAMLLALFAAPATAAPAASYDEPYRPQFHYTPAENWINDPNGMVYHDGTWHLYYQYNPEGNDWGHMSWGHATSTDLVHWDEQGVAISEDDEEMIFSGSAVVDENNTSGFGTAENPPIVAIYTSAYRDTGIQAQSLAYSLDGGYTYTKYADNPVLDIGSREFRDPKVFWYEPAQEWRMVVAMATDHQIAIYGSPNLIDWTHLSDFGPEGAVGGVWECPDLFPLPVDGDESNQKWVMIVNLNPGSIAGGSGGQYFVGEFDGTTFTSDDPDTYTPPTGTVLQDFESGSYALWVTQGEAFGDAPATGNLPGQAGVDGFEGYYLANSFHGGDATTGTLTSPEFVIDADHLNFLVGGGTHPAVEGTSLEPWTPTGEVFADFEGPTWGEGWSATGDFVDEAPATGAIDDQQEVTGFVGNQLVNTFTDHDVATGTISSPTFTIDSSHINLLVGGGAHSWWANPERATAVNLVVNGEVVASASGRETEWLNWVAWDVSAWQGQQAQIVIVDNNTGGWGHINVDHILFSDSAAVPLSVETTVNLVVDGETVRSTTGPNSEVLDWASWDVSEFAGRTASIVLIDNNTGGFGHILADQFTLADEAATSATERAHWLDYGRDFYAGVTWSNAPDGRRVMIAWMNNWQYAGAVPAAPPSAMTVPRELTLATVDGQVQLLHAPVAELDQLREPAPYSVTIGNMAAGRQILRTSGDTLDIVATMRARDAERFGLKVRMGNGQETLIGYDTQREGIFVDRTASGNVAFHPSFASEEFAPLPLNPDGTVTLRILVDRSSVEVFAGDGRVTITDVIFPDLSSTAIGVFSDGGRAKLDRATVWQMDSIW